MTQTKMKPVGAGGEFGSKPLVTAQEPGEERKTWGSGVHAEGAAEYGRWKEQSEQLGFKSLHAYLLWAVRYVSAGVARGDIKPELRQTEGTEIVQPDYPKE